MLSDKTFMSNQNLGDTSHEVSAILVILLLQYYYETGSNKHFCGLLGRKFAKMKNFLSIWRSFAEKMLYLRC